MTFKENVMNNEQKKEYVKPEMTVIEYGHQSDLLCASCYGDQQEYRIVEDDD